MELSLIVQRNIGDDLENVACLWTSNSKNIVINMVAAAMMWSTGMAFSLGDACGLVYGHRLVACGPLS